MRNVCFLFVLYVILSSTGLAQSRRILTSPDGKFRVYSTQLGFDAPLSFADLLKAGEKVLHINMNADAPEDREKWKKMIVVQVQNDSVRVSYQGNPTEPVTIINGRDTITAEVRYLDNVPKYSAAYQTAHQGKTLVEISPVVELVHVAIALTPTGQKDRDMIHTSGPYYQQVMTRFAPYKNHPLIVRLDSLLRADGWAYHNLFHDAYTYDLKNGQLVPGAIYKSKGVMRPLETAFQDFAKKSRFVDFLAKNKVYYQQSIARETRLMPMRKMWQWVEKEYPNRYDCYKTVYSPLTGGNHSTRNYAADGYRECVMFVCGTEVLDQDKRPPLVQEAAMSGIVFTEIDHNYVNPISDRYIDSINSVFSDRAKWTVTGGPADTYEGAYAVFNEYMTHAVYCLYVRENYPPAVFKQVNAFREELMVDHRKFTRFREFNQKLMDLYSQRKPGQTAADLYPAMLDWCRSVN